MFRTIKGGCQTRHSGNFYMLRDQGVEDHVLLIIHTASHFQIDGADHDLEPGAAVWITPGTPYRYHNPEGDYMDDWIHFVMTDDSVNTLTFPANIPFQIADPMLYSTLIHQLLWEVSYPVSKEMLCDNTQALFRVLCNHLSVDHATQTSHQKRIPYQSELLLIRMNMKSSAGADHSISYYAEELHISSSYFQHLYQALFHVSFQRDLIDARINYAKDLLRFSNLPVSQIALLCGYQTEVHFHRQFKQLVGATPAHYRKE